MSQDQINRFFREVAEIQATPGAALAGGLAGYFLLTLKNNTTRITWTREPGNEIRQKVMELAKSLFP